MFYKYYLRKIYHIFLTYLIYFFIKNILMFFKLRATFWKVDFFLNTIIEKKHKIGMQCKRIP